MKHSFPFTQEASYLESYRLPPPSFNEPSILPGSGDASWPAIPGQGTDPRMRSIRMILSQKDHREDQETVALQVALADSMWRAGKSANALKMVFKALELYPKQWMANRIYVDILMAKQEYERAYDIILSLKDLPSPASWDLPLPLREVNVCAASCAWRMKEWERVAELLKEAFPDGVESMPRGLQEDWFRLALYRHQPDDAAAAAALLVSSNALDFSDALLQTLVQRGWTHQALPLYRTMYDQVPRNQLLRRRLVALCIKEGEIEEARRLAKPGALDLNP